MNLMETNPDKLRLKFMAGEMQGMRKVLEYLVDGNQEAFNAILWCKSNYRDWAEMLQWCLANKLQGKRLVELMMNESPDGGGYHMGWEYIHARMNGSKFDILGIKMDELI